jgi:hypothetical protein
VVWQQSFCNDGGIGIAPDNTITANAWWQKLFVATSKALAEHTRHL